MFTSGRSNSTNISQILFQTRIRIKMSMSQWILALPVFEALAVNSMREQSINFNAGPMTKLHGLLKSEAGN